MPTRLSTDPSGGAQPLPFPGRIIRAGGMDRTIVLTIQHRLNAVGCGPIEDNGTVGQQTTDAVQLLQGRWPDTDGLPLTVDGPSGPISNVSSSAALPRIGAVGAVARRAVFGLVGVVMVLVLGCSESDHGTPAGQSEPPTGQPGTSAVTLAPAGQPLAIVQSTLARHGPMANHIPFDNPTGFAETVSTTGNLDVTNAFF